MISNASVLKDNGAYLLKEDISKEEYDRINLNIMYRRNRRKNEKI